MGLREGDLCERLSGGLQLRYVFLHVPAHHHRCRLFVGFQPVVLEQMASQLDGLRPCRQFIVGMEPVLLRQILV